VTFSALAFSALAQTAFEGFSPQGLALNEETVRTIWLHNN